jgi:hypothetical protein
MLLHSDPVAQNGPSSERTGGIDRENAYRLAILTKSGDHAIHERGLPNAWRSCKSDYIRSTSVTIEQGEIVEYLMVSVVDPADQLSGCSDVTLNDFFGK